LRFVSNVHKEFQDNTASSHQRALKNDSIGQPAVLYKQKVLERCGE